MSKPYAHLLAKYYPDIEIAEEIISQPKPEENHFSVINCSKYELQAELKKLPPGRKQIEMCKWQDEVTVIVNELDVI